MIAVVKRIQQILMETRPYPLARHLPLELLVPPPVQVQQVAPAICNQAAATADAQVQEAVAEALDLMATASVPYWVQAVGPSSLILPGP